MQQQMVTISRMSTSQERPEKVQLIVTRDQATFLMNLVEERLEEILKFIRDQEMLDLSEAEANQLYEDKNMAHELAILLNI